MARPLGNVIQLRRTPEYGGQWLSAQTKSAPESVRERVGRHVASTLDTTAGMGLRVTDPFRLLAPDQLWLVYTRTPDVRSAIDGIVRRIATWRWTIDVEGLSPDPEDGDDFDGAMDAADEAERFLRAPNGNGETWQELMTKVVTDLLVFEQGSIEEVYDKLVSVPLPRPADLVAGKEEPASVKIPAEGAKLEELVAINGASIIALSDTFGRVYGYQQDVYGTLGPLTNGGRFGDPVATAPYFSREQIVQFSLFPNTSGRSAPLIETIVNEVITILRASEHSMLAMDADEIPPGILVLTGVAGKAAEAAKTDLQRMKGKDHKIRVITNPDPRGSGANWVELRRTPKDLSMIDVVREVRRTIWRVFGVLPVEMGDTQDMPRAVGQVQLDVSTSHLVEPILDLIEAKINARILPLLVGDEFAGNVFLRFDREAKLSPTEQREKSAALVSLVREGLLTRNEARQEIDQDPIDGGDVATITTTLGLKRVDSLGAPGAIPGPVAPAPAPAPAPASDDSAPGEVDGGTPGETAPGEAGDAGLVVEAVRRARLELVASAHAPTCGCGACPIGRALILPSSWPSASIFKGYRTVALGPLAEAVSQYTKSVEPLYDEAADEVLAAVGAAYDQSMRPEEAQRAVSAVNAAMAKLHTRWSLATAPLYERVAKSSRDQATEFTALPVVEDWQARGAAYGERAMRFLVDPGGLISDLRASLIATIAAATGEPSGRAVSPVPKGIVPGVEEGQLLSALYGLFESARSRIENWSGKLVELASEVLAGGMAEGAAEAGEWLYEWVAVGDGAMCSVCTYEGQQGFRPASQLRVHPGGSTQCRANCRCVLVYWTRGEVSSGSAVRLSGNAPGNSPL